VPPRVVRHVQGRTCSAWPRPTQRVPARNGGATTLTGGCGVGWAQPPAQSRKGAAPLPGAAPALLERRHRGAAWNAPATAIRDWPKASATSPLDAFEAYVDLRWGQGLVYDAGFVESHVAVRRERDDQQHDLWRWRGWTRAARASRSSATMPAARGYRAAAVAARLIRMIAARRAGPRQRLAAAGSSRHTLPDLGRAA
jgi:hypothetical protein